MAIAISNLTTKGSTGAGTSLATSSVTPTANNLVLVTVVSRTGITTDPNQPTLTGNGLTWVAINSVVFDNTSSSRRRDTLFRAMGASPSAGAITADFGGQSQTSAAIIVDSASGIDTTGTNGSGAIVQSATNFDGSGTATSLTVTLAAFGSTNNATYGAWGFGNPAQASTAGSGFTKLGEVVDSVPDVKATSEYRLSNDTTVDMSYAAGGEIGGIAIEIKAAATTTSQTVTGKADILKATLQTIPGVARVTKVVAQTIIGLSRITVATARTITGKADILKATLQTIPGVSRITKVVSSTVTGLARITKAAPQTITGLARITKSVAQTISGRADILKSTTRTATGVARIQKTVAQTVTGLARITISTLQTATGKARITVATLRTTTGVARITVSTSRTIAGVARVTKTVSQTIQGVARIGSGITTQTVTGLARVTVSTLRTIPGTARITKVVSRTVTGLARIMRVSSEVNSPTDYTGLVLWLKADSLSLNDGDAIATWSDSSGNGFNASGSGTVSPLYKTSILNGLPVVRFSGSNGFQLAASGSAESSFDLATSTIIVVARKTGGSGSTVISKNTTSFSDGRRRKIQIGINSQLQYTSGTDSNAISTAMTVANWNIAAVISKADNNHDLIVNGVVNNNTAAIADSTFNDARVEIGQAFSNGAERLTGDIAEIIVYNRPLTAAEYQDVAHYLSLKWGLGSPIIKGVARMQKAVSQTVTGVSRITTLVSQTVTGKARIQTVGSQTVTGMSRVQLSRNQTLTGTASISIPFNTTQITISGVSRILARKWEHSSPVQWYDENTQSWKTKTPLNWESENTAIWNHKNTASWQSSSIAS